MWNALFAFDHLADAQAASASLTKAGFPSKSIRSHHRPSGRTDDAVNRIDEQVTGGLLTNLYNLFQGVFDWGGSPHESAAFEATVNRGGVVLDIQADDPAACELVDRCVGPTCTKRTEWVPVE